MAGKVTAWVGWVWFAAFTLIALGLFNITTGLVAVFNTKDVVAWTNSGLAIVDVSTWGWVHLVVGVLILLTGFALFGGAGWARFVAILLVIVNLVTQFVSLPVTPWWSLVVIGLDIVVLWALVVHGEEAERAAA